jgi:hypothetical protein
MLYNTRDSQRITLSAGEETWHENGNASTAHMLLFNDVILLLFSSQK